MADHDGGPSASSLAHKTVVVTGAAQGVGAASAALFAANGAQVAICDKNIDTASSLAKELRDAGSEAIAIEVDVADERSVSRCADLVARDLGAVSVVHVNAAVMTTFGSILDTTASDWDTMMAVNVRGAFLTARAFLPQMIRGGGGAFCFTGSDTALRSPRQYAAYSTSKHALIGLARSIAVDFGSLHIRSNLVSPGAVDTPGLRRLYSDSGLDPQAAIDAIIEHSVLPNIADPREVAEAVVFLCSARSRHTTGANLVVDGGLTVLYEAE